MRVPSRIVMGRGVRMRKRSSGGVMLCRLAASEKKAKTSSRGSGNLMRVLRTWSAPLLLLLLLLLLRLTVASVLGGAPVGPRWLLARAFLRQAERKRCALRRPARR